ncbi:hypothetical protein LXT13_27305 [Pelomonas sp. P8]|uniref:Transcription factor zinc-finger domain-containing protein n=2 Tax=Pelomonas cellulosilytica TaxID=2906762 RepID=A0ABS8XZR8_9BURK|nr:hypothetical protein [Pelomonas sp. P8]
MQVHALPATYGGTVEIDFCFDCQGLWFDHLENIELAPAAVDTVFKEIHRHRDTAQRPLGATLRCAECRGRLVQGFDVVRSGRFVTHRCEQRHGRFSTFSAFMIEITRPEIADIAAKVGCIHCSSCGAPVDLRREDACSHCRTALSLLDPQAVEKAMQTYAWAPAPQDWGSPSDVAAAIVAMEKERSRTQREQPAAGIDTSVTGLLSVDLLSVSLRLLGTLLDV